MPTAYFNQTEIAEAVEKVIKTLGPEVVRVRYNVGEDWTGDPALYFRIVLADSAIDLKNLKNVSEVTDRISAALEQAQPLENWGLFPHFRFRTKSEQDQSNDPAWA